jgi:hypothetical protein
MVAEATAILAGAVGPAEAFGSKRAVAARVEPQVPGLQAAQAALELTQLTQVLLKQVQP